MRDLRTDSVIAAILARYPGTRVEVRPNPAPGMPTIPDHIVVLDVPDANVVEVRGFALDIAFAAFGDDPLPFLIGAVDVEQSARYYPARPVAPQLAQP